MLKNVYQAVGLTQYIVRAKRQLKNFSCMKISI